MPHPHVLRAVAGLILIATAAVLAAPVFSQDRIRRGAYLAAIMDCAGCHTTGALTGTPMPQRHLAGATVGFEVPGLGVVYPPNLTPDPKTGLGSWSEADLVRALRTGLRPDGRALAAVRRRSYSALSQDDARALAAYLKSIPPVRHQPPPTHATSERAAAHFALRLPQ